MINELDLWCPSCDVPLDSQKTKIDDAGFLRCLCGNHARKKAEVDRVRNSLKYKLRTFWRKLVKQY